MNERHTGAKVDPEQVKTACSIIRGQRYTMPANVMWAMRLVLNYAETFADLEIQCRKDYEASDDDLPS